MEEKARICPICHKAYTDYPALSRKDNKTEICPDCGVEEAMQSYFKYLMEKEGEKEA